MTESGEILIGCEGAAVLGGLEEALTEAGYRVRIVSDAPGLIAQATGSEPDIVLLHDSLGEVEPLEVVRELRRRRAAHVPMVLLGHESDGETIAATALRAGAADFLRAPFDLEESLARIAGHVERGRLIRDAQREANTRGMILEVVRDVTSSLSSEEIFHLLVRRVSRLFRVSRCSMILVDNDAKRGTVVAAHDDPSINSLAIDLDRYPEIQKAVETGAPLLVEDVRDSPLFEEVRPLWESENISVELQSVVAVPFNFDAGRSGVFFLRSNAEEPPLDEESVRVTSTIVQGAVRALNRAALFESLLSHQEQLEILAKTDELTGCLSRRYLMERLENELERAGRYERLLGLVMFDIDDFKELNDAHGHTTGDAALRSIGEVLRRSLRTADFVGRYGGDEFLLVLPETSLGGTHQLAERIRSGISRRDFELRDGNTIRLTVSGGVAAYPEAGVATADDLIDRADRALYRAKSDGRNSVAVDRHSTGSGSPATSGTGEERGA